MIKYVFILLVSISILFILISGCSQDDSSDNNLMSEIRKEMREVCGKYPDYRECVPRFTKMHPNVTACDIHPRWQERSLCIISQAYKEGKEEYCDLITNENRKAECKLQFSTETEGCLERRNCQFVAVNTRSIEPCYEYTKWGNISDPSFLGHGTESYVPSSFAWCFYDLAIYLDNVSICKHMYDYMPDWETESRDSRYWWCADILIKDELEACLLNKIIWGRENCLSKLAVNEGDIEVCEMIATNRKKNYCRLRVAKATNNIEYCDLIELERPKGDCLYYLSDDERLKTELCKDAERNHTCAWESDTEKAVKALDPSLCPDQLWRGGKSAEECVRQIVSILKDPKICSYHPMDYVKVSCYNKYKYGVLSYPHRPDSTGLFLGVKSQNETKS